ncbi:MAG: hypothetical protein HYS06_00880 [Methylocystis sp.]|nr:hypothetical protein [Methylocystis sp.]
MNSFDQECIEARPWFEQWREREEFIARFDTLYARRQTKRQFGNNATKWINEAWILTKIARVLKPSHLCWSQADPPDALMRIGDTETPVEITYVDHPTRQIAKEYQNPREPSVGMKFCPDEDFDEPHLIRILRKRLLDKSGKRYPKETFLFVNMNAGINFEDDDDSVNKKIRCITNSQNNVFRAIFILWGSQVYGPSDLIANGCGRFAESEIES